MIWVLYNVLFVIGYTLMLPYFIFRMCRRGGYARDFAERFCVIRPEKRQKLSDPGRIWVHAVSVGEILVALRLLSDIRARLPNTTFVLTTTTSTGHAIAEKRMDKRDVLLYFPVDFPPVMNRELSVLSPSALILIEGELWPNLLRLCKRKDIPVILVNGRISERSTRGYRLAGAFTRKGLQCLDLLCVQAEEDRDRLVSLGGDPDRIKIVGSAKYDTSKLDISSKDVASEVLASAGMSGKTILVGGSTWAGEEDELLRIYKELRKTKEDVRLVLVPRHFERASSVLKEIDSHGLTCLRRSKVSETAPGDYEVLLVDSTGELSGFYAHADVIFVGKSLASHGGQNPIEPALIGKPIIVGPNMENFPGVMRDFLARDGLVQVQSAGELSETLLRMLSDENMRSGYCERSRSVVEELKGTIDKTIDLMLPLIDKH